MNKKNFDEWMQETDTRCSNVYGLSIFDLPDCPYADWYEDGVTPVSAAKKAYRMAEGEE